MELKYIKGLSDSNYELHTNWDDNVLSLLAGTTYGAEEVLRAVEDEDHVLEADRDAVTLALDELVYLVGRIRDAFRYIEVITPDHYADEAELVEE